MVDATVERLSYELETHTRVAGEIIREMQAEIERLAADNARLYRTILPDGSHRECPKCYRGEISGCDDGSWIELGCMAGGANAHGMNGWLELIEHEADGTERRREYVATDSPLYGRPTANGEA